ncbi:MAG: adenosine deaminase [Ignavibacteriaceae bacterium]|nr:adenosine deaminase [Ignavibacteriaceae bacterium]
MNKDFLLENFINGIPKAELHLHIEGTFEPELMFKIAKRNNISIKYSSVEELRNAYSFNNLQDFLNIYYAGANVLVTQEDFYDLTKAYLDKVHLQNVQHCEIFFDPQTHTSRGIGFGTIINGIHKALVEAKEQDGITSKLIMCFLRDLDSDSAMKTLEEAIPFKDWIMAVGLDSAEVGNPPSKFTEIFNHARNNGFITVAHAGEEGPADYIWEALDLLKVSRIDHGNNSLDDKKLVDELVRLKVPLTICPLSNYKLRVVKDLKNHPLKKMMNMGLVITINSDDPAYFGGYINENYCAIAEALELSKEDIYLIAKNSINASFLNDNEKELLYKKVDAYMELNK